MKLYIIAIFLFIFSFYGQCSNTVSLVSTKQQTAYLEEFYISVYLADVSTFKSISFTMGFDNSKFEALDNNPDAPNGNTDGQLSIGDVFGNEYAMDTNEINNSTGKIEFNIADDGVGKIKSTPVLVAQAKFRCITSDASSFSFTLTGISVGSSSVDDKSLSIYTGSDSINLIGPSGGIATGAGGISLDFPEGSLLTDQNITITKKSSSDLPLSFSNTGEIVATSLAFKIGPDMYLRRPVSISIDFSNSGISSSDEKYLKLYWLDQNKNAWYRMAGNVDTTNNILTATTIHFSYFLVAVDKYNDTHIRISRFSAYPNPFSPNGNNRNDRTTITFYISKDAEEVTLNIYDVNGRTVRTLLDKASYSEGEYHIEWDGKNQYDETMVTGVYIAKISVKEDENINVEEKTTTIVLSKNMNE